MPRLTLDITEGGKVARTYSVDGYDIAFGTLMDLIGLAEGADDPGKAFSQLGFIKPFLADLFPDITDEDIRRVRVSDAFRLLEEAMAVALEGIGRGPSPKAARKGRK